MNFWTRERELKYWSRYHPEFYINYIQSKYAHFQVEPCEVAVDVGGGKYGGALRFCPATKRILVDSLGSRFELPGIDIIEADFGKIPLGDNSADAIFCWETLDHALDKEHLLGGQKEIKRILKPNGILYFNHILRENPTEGHTVILGTDELLKGFGMQVKSYEERPFFNNGKEIFATLCN